MIESDGEEVEDLSMGPCMVCKRLGSTLPAQHTHCECDKEDCEKVICDDCRMLSGQWADGTVDSHFVRAVLQYLSGNAKAAPDYIQKWEARVRKICAEWRYPND